LTPSSPVPSLIDMDVPLNPDLQAKLSRLAAQQGRASEALVVEAIERLVNYDEWFLREVDKGLAAADRGELVEHQDVRKMIDQRYPG
jgi:predicted transcriptional regulator